MKVLLASLLFANCYAFAESCQTLASSAQDCCVNHQCGDKDQSQKDKALQGDMKSSSDQATTSGMTGGANQIAAITAKSAQMNKTMGPTCSTRANSCVKTCSSDSSEAKRCEGYLGHGQQMLKQGNADEAASKASAANAKLTGDSTTDCLNDPTCRANLNQSTTVQKSGSAQDCAGDAACAAALASSTKAAAPSSSSNVDDCVNNPTCAANLASSTRVPASNSVNAAACAGDASCSAAMASQSESASPRQSVSECQSDPACANMLQESLNSASGH